MKVKQEVLAVLSRMEANGNVLRITDGQLDRKLYTALNDVLTAMGGKWNTKQKGHVFLEDPTAKVEATILAGEITVPKDFGYFPTPPEVVAVLLDLAEIEPGMTVVEPSAGQGAIADAVAAIVGKDNVYCTELLPDNCKVLLSKGYTGIDPYGLDFTKAAPLPDHDRVVMNPPFERQQDIDHVLHAFRFLKPGGRLVSVMSAGVMFRENRKTVDFRQFVDDHGGYFQPLDEGAFKSSGTMVNTVVVRIDK